MKKLSIIVLSLLALAFSGCKQVEMPFTHEDSDVVITSMLMWNLPHKNITSDSKFAVKESVEATITQGEPNEVGEIVFIVPRTKRSYWDLTEVYLQATVGYDLYITPSIAGAKDLTLDDEGKPRLTVTVKSKRTGFEKKYNIHAEISYI